MKSFIWLLGYLVEIQQWERGRGRAHPWNNTKQPRTYPKTTNFVRNVIIEGASLENKMAGKEQITSEWASS